MKRETVGQAGQLVGVRARSERFQNGPELDAARLNGGHALFLSGVIFDAGVFPRNAAHASIIRRRFSNMSPRR